MSYIESIRKYIGHAPMISGAAGAIILNDKNEILLQKRSDDGCWGYPGGGMELGESLLDTLIRETYEETGLKVKNPIFFKVYSGESEHIVYPNQDEVYYINALYIVREYSGNISMLDGESLELKFFDFDHLPSNLTKSMKFVLKDLLEYLSK